MAARDAAIVQRCTNYVDLWIYVNNLPGIRDRFFLVAIAMALTGRRPGSESGPPLTNFMQAPVTRANSISDFFRKLPKTEIHLHLEAIASVETIFSLMYKYKLAPDGIRTIEQLRQMFHVRSLDEFINVFMNIIQPCFQDEEDFRMLLRDAREYLRRNNIYYAEVFMAPTRFLQLGLQYNRMLDIMEVEADIGEREDGVDIRFLIDVSRSFGPENAMRNLELVLSYPHKRVIGIGLGGAELGNPARDYAAVFAKARAHGLHVVAHAGEDVGPESVREAIELLGAERIGHGLAAHLDPALMDLLVERQIPLEVCPTSNVFTQRFVKRLADHPIRLFYDRGLRVTLNTDDPMIFGVELNQEYANLYEHCNFKAGEIVDILFQGLDATFMQQPEKNFHRERVRQQVQFLQWQWDI